MLEMKQKTAYHNYHFNAEIYTSKELSTRYDLICTVCTVVEI